MGQSGTEDQGAYCLPDYGGASLVNLMSSISAALGGPASDYPASQLAGLDALPEARNVVLLVIDGLGYEFLCRHGDGTTLAGHLQGRMTSVFPATTAAAVSTFATGLGPQQHAFTGWYMYLKELGTVAAVLPFRSRYGGSTLGAAGIDAARIFNTPSLFERLPVRSYAVMHEHIIHSDFSTAALGCAERLPYTSLKGLFQRITQALGRGEQRKYVYAYWSNLDGLAHEFGADSHEVIAHFQELDAAFAAFLKTLRGSGTTVIVTADHGLIDTEPERIIQVHDHAPLADGLVLPLCGEPRLAYCYVRAGRAGQFEDYVRTQLAHACDLYQSEQLVRDGWFGLGEAHPRLRDRIGDYALVMKDNYVVKDRVLGETPYQQIGVHGGVSAEEMFVPLIVVVP